MHAFKTSLIIDPGIWQSICAQHGVPWAIWQGIWHAQLAQERSMHMSQMNLPPLKACGKASGTPGRAPAEPGKASGTLGQASQVSGKASGTLGQASQVSDTETCTLGQASQASGIETYSLGQARPACGTTTCTAALPSPTPWNSDMHLIPSITASDSTMHLLAPPGTRKKSQTVETLRSLEQAQTTPRRSERHLPIHIVGGENITL